MFINLAKTALQNFFDLIADANPAAASTVTAVSTEVGSPTVRVPDANPRNTTTNLKAKDGGGLTGANIDVTFNRVSIAAATVSPVLDFTVGGNDAAAATALLATAAGQLGIIAGEFNFTDQETPLAGVVKGDPAASVELTAVASSLLYNGTVTINVTWPADPPTLDNQVVNKDLTGFDTPS